jgi:hypothetical protein
LSAALRDHRKDGYAAEQIAGSLFILDSAVKALTETVRQLIFNTIPHELDHIPGSIENGRAVGAHFEVSFHPCAQFGIDLAVNIIGDLSPDL